MGSGRTEAKRGACELEALRMMASLIFARCSREVWRGLAPSVLAMLLLLLTGAMMPALAQSCTSDSQCRDFGQTRTYCSGNSLVTVQSRCIGSCRPVELSRVPCPGPCVADR